MLIFMAVILLRENVDLNLTQLNSTKNVFCLLSTLKSRDIKMSAVWSFPWGLQCPLRKKKETYYTTQ